MRAGAPRYPIEAEAIGPLGLCGGDLSTVIPRLLIDVSKLLAKNEAITG